MLKIIAAKYEPKKKRGNLGIGYTEKYECKKSSRTKVYLEIERKLKCSEQINSEKIYYDTKIVSVITLSQKIGRIGKEIFQYKVIITQHLNGKSFTQIDIYSFDRNGKEKEMVTSAKFNDIIFFLDNEFRQKFKHTFRQKKDELCDSIYNQLYYFMDQKRHGTLRPGATLGKGAQAKIFKGRGNYAIRKEDNNISRITRLEKEFNDLFFSMESTYLHKKLSEKGYIFINSLKDWAISVDIDGKGNGTTKSSSQSNWIIVQKLDEENCSLEDIISIISNLDEDRKLKIINVITLQLLLVFYIFKDNKILHTDIKPANILVKFFHEDISNLSRKDILKIDDLLGSKYVNKFNMFLMKIADMSIFKLKKFRKQKMKYDTSPEYQSPEFLIGRYFEEDESSFKKLTSRSLVWSLGIIIYTLWTGKDVLRQSVPEAFEGESRPSYADVAENYVQKICSYFKDAGNELDTRKKNYYSGATMNNDLENSICSTISPLFEDVKKEEISNRLQQALIADPSKRPSVKKLLKNWYGISNSDIDNHLKRENNFSKLYQEKFFSK